MALVLALKLDEVVYIGGKKTTVTEIVDHSLVKVETEFGDVVELTDRSAVEVYPQVFMNVGEPVYSTTSTRLVFNAPRDIPIVRHEMQKDGNG